MSTLALILGTEANTDAGRLEIGAQSQAFTAAVDAETRAAALARTGSAVAADGRISRHVPEAFTMNPTGRLATSVAHAAALPSRLTVRRPRGQAAGGVLPQAFGLQQAEAAADAQADTADVEIDLMPFYQTWADKLRLEYDGGGDPASLSGTLGAALTHAVLRDVSLTTIRQEMEAKGYEVFKAWAGTASFMKEDAYEAVQRVQLESSRASADFLATVRRGLDSTTQSRYVEAQAAARAILRVEEVFNRLGGRYLPDEQVRTLRALTDEGTHARAPGGDGQVMAAAQAIARGLQSPRDVVNSAFSEPDDEWIGTAMRSAAIEVNAADMVSDVLSYVSAESALAGIMRMAQEVVNARDRMQRGLMAFEGAPATEQAHGQLVRDAFHSIASRHMAAHPRVLELVAGSSRIVKACESAADFANQVITAINRARIGVAPSVAEAEGRRGEAEIPGDGGESIELEARDAAQFEFGEYAAAFDPADSIERSPA